MDIVLQMVNFVREVKCRMKMKYSVFLEDVNRNTFVSYNIFEHTAFVADLKKLIEEVVFDRDVFDEELRSILQYYFWCKCEYEIVISSLIFHDRTKPIKVDVYKQIMLNWNVFEEYIWNNRDRIKNIKRVQGNEV